jgi:hypothetical protein
MFPYGQLDGNVVTYQYFHQLLYCQILSNKYEHSQTEEVWSSLEYEI